MTGWIWKPAVVSQGKQGRKGHLDFARIRAYVCVRVHVPVQMLALNTVSADE